MPGRSETAASNRNQPQNWFRQKFDRFFSFRLVMAGIFLKSPLNSFKEKILYDLVGLKYPSKNLHFHTETP
jgi:hypothetical protein